MNEFTAVLVAIGVGLSAGLVAGWQPWNGRTRHYLHLRRIGVSHWFAWRIAKDRAATR